MAQSASFLLLRHSLGLALAVAAAAAATAQWPLSPAAKEMADWISYKRFMLYGAERWCDLTDYSYELETLGSGINKLEIRKDDLLTGRDLYDDLTAEEAKQLLPDAKALHKEAKERYPKIAEECAKKAKQAKAPPPEPPLPPTPDPDDQSPGARIARAAIAHAAAAAKCDEAEMRRRLEELKQLEAEAKAQAKASKAAGKFSAVSPEQAAKDLKSASIELLNAQQRKPEDCPKPSPTDKPPATETGKPPPPALSPGGSRDCPVPGTPGGSAPGKSPPEHGMRFTPPDDKSQRMLAAHNRARAEVGVRPLTWDRELVTGAAEYAAQMSTVGRAHAPREGRKCVRENLLQSLRGGRTPEQMVGVWVSERANFKPGIFPHVSTTGEWAKVGHYTQIIWSTTTHVGCAVHSDARYDWTVCRYSPPGNIDGRPVM